MSLLLILPLSGCRETILHNLSELEANRCLTKLGEASIVANKEKQPDGKWSLSVEKEDSLVAIKRLDESRLLKDLAISSKERTSFVSSKEDQKFHFERALSGEIEKTLLSLDGVLEARVHLNLPATDPILGNRLANAKGSGSVLLVVQPNFAMQQDALALLVSGAAGIEKSQISVLFSRELAPEVNQIAKLDPVSAPLMPQVVAAPEIQVAQPYLRWGLGSAAALFLTLGVILLLRRRLPRAAGNFGKEMEAFHSEAFNAIGNSVGH